MPKEVTCPPCGEVIRGDDEDDLVEKVQAHARDEHDMTLERDQILGMAHDA